MTHPCESNAWLVSKFAPVSLFSLKASFATSSVGTTLVVPTPYSLKMALVDAAFRMGYPEQACGELLRALIAVAVRISPPDAVVTHTFGKIRQEPKPDKNKPDQPPYISNVAYREFAHHSGEWRWAFGLIPDSGLASQVRELLPHLRYIGRRGGFVQFLGTEWVDRLDDAYTSPVNAGGVLALPTRCHVVPLDDFGPEASLEILSSFSTQKARREKHRVFVETIVPLGRVRSGAGFTEYRK